MSRHCIVQILVVLLLLEVLFCIPHLEEISVLQSSEVVVTSMSYLTSLLQWLLYVPEIVVWDRFEDLILQILLETLPVSFSHVL
jgi:hypothetical protein